MKNYRARCFLCPWISKLNQGPVFAAGNGMKHVKKEHPKSEGFVVLVEKVVK